MSRIDPAFYSRWIQPSNTRSAVPPIRHFPLQKLRISYKHITNPNYHVYNTQGFLSSKFRDADADAGKHYYIHIDSYDTSSKTHDIINEVSPLLINPDTFIPGAYYTYIIAAESERGTHHTSPPPQIYVTRTINMFEFGTKHQQIMYRKAMQDKQCCNEYRIYTAGEIMCVNENTLIFNFISGTYKMKRYISNKRAIYEQAYIQYLMTNIAPKYTNILFQKDTLISAEVLSLSLTKNEIARLKQHHVPMFLFPSQQECDRMKYAIIRHAYQTKKSITNEELEEINTQIRNNSQS